MIVTSVDSDQEESFELDTPLSKLLDSVHQSILHQDVPWPANLDFATVLGKQDDLDSIADACPVTLTHQFAAMLSSPDPPSFKALLALPIPCGLIWGVYVLCFEKIGETPEMYLGSGTDADGGVKVLTEVSDH